MYRIYLCVVQVDRTEVCGADANSQLSELRLD